MSRKWYREDWRKIYTRMESAWLALPSTARSLASDLIKYASEDGTIIADLAGDDPGDRVARLLGAHKFEEKIVSAAVKTLLDDRYLVLKGKRLTVRNHHDAQTKLSPEALRKRKQREREDAEAAEMVRDNDVTNSVTVTPDVTGQASGQSQGDVTHLSAGDETRRDETKKRECVPPARDPSTTTHVPPKEPATPRKPAAWRTGIESRWSKLADVPGFSFPGILDLADLIDKAAVQTGREPGELFDLAVVKFHEYRANCSHGRAPMLTPHGLVAKWSEVWQLIAGTAPTGKTATRNHRRSTMQGPVEPSDFSHVPAEGRDALADFKG